MIFLTIWKNFFVAKSHMGTLLEWIFFTQKKNQLAFREYLNESLKITCKLPKDSSSFLQGYNLNIIFVSKVLWEHHSIDFFSTKKKNQFRSRAHGGI